jgi:hypothetical protein
MHSSLIDQFIISLCLVTQPLVKELHLTQTLVPMDRVKAKLTTHRDTHSGPHSHLNSPSTTCLPYASCSGPFLDIVYE